MARVLVVAEPFNGHDKGDRITDPQEIEKVLAGEQAHHVIPSDHADLDTPKKSS